MQLIYMALRPVVILHGLSDNSSYLYRADFNFDTYASRLRTFDRCDASASDTLGMISSATIGSTALVAPPVAAGLAAAKLLAQGKTTDIQKDFLNGDTVDVMQKAMQANRATMEGSINAKLFVNDGKTSATNAPSATSPGTSGPALYKSYTMFDVLDDIRKLNEASSIYGTLQNIPHTADSQTQAAETVSARVKTSQKGTSPTEVKSAAAK
jgi:hypothetical protein